MFAGFMFKIILTLVTVIGIVFSLNHARAQVANIYVNASQILHTNTIYLTGACLEDVNHEVYGGLYSQMIFGESFQEPAHQRHRWLVLLPTVAHGRSRTEF